MESAEQDALPVGWEAAGKQSAKSGREVVGEQVAQDGQAPRFEDLGLSEPVLNAVHDLGYEEPTPVQAQAIPLVLEGRDLMAAAQTGTGKTAAFLLPAMDRLPHAKQVSARGRTAAQGPFMLVVTPTRELAEQIEEVCQTIAHRTWHTCVTVVGGVSYNPQRDALKRGCDILIATPGRLLDLIDQECCSLDQVRVLVLDEADRMLDMGFLPSVRRIVDYTPAERQTLLFSATLDQKAVGGITDLVHDPACVEIAPVTEPVDTVAQYVLPVSAEAKNGMLAQVLKREGAHRVIVFTRTKRRADTCCKRLARAGITCAAIHGDRSQNQRERALAQFRSGEIDVLVATDVLARGIDISDVSYVVNFDVPSEPIDYIHRIGRTGRAGETGWSLTFVTRDDVDDFYDIEALMGRTVETFDTAGLELGEDPPRLDPHRRPAKQGATRAQKRRRKQQNTSRAQAAKAARRAGATSGGGSGTRSGNGSGNGNSRIAGPSGGRSNSSGSAGQGANMGNGRGGNGSGTSGRGNGSSDNRSHSSKGSQPTGRSSSGQGRSSGSGSGNRSGRQQTGRASTQDNKRQGGRATGSQKHQGGRATGSQKRQGGSGSNRSDGSGRSGGGSRSNVGADSSSGSARRSGSDGRAFEGSTRAASDTWRNYDEPSARDARLYNATTPNGNRAESRSGRHPGDGGGDQ